MAGMDLTVTEEWIREKLQLHHNVLADVRTLCLPGDIEGKISHLGISLKKFVRLKTLDLSYNALVSVSGIEHLKELEKLNLYFNKISAPQEVMTISRMKSLKVVDLRLNPVVNKHPEYRLHLVHSLCQLRKLDDCPVRDRERKVALMHFSTDVELEHKKASHSTRLPDQRASDLRLAAVHRLTKSLTLRDGNEESAMNYINDRKRPQTRPQPLSQREPESLPAQEIPDEVIYLVNEYEPDIYLQNTESLKTAFRHSQGTNVHRARPCSQPRRKSSLTDMRPSGRAANRTRVTFADGCVQGNHSIHPLPANSVRQPLQHQLRVPAVPMFTADPRASSSSSASELSLSSSAKRAAATSPSGQRALEVGDLSSLPPAHHSLPCRGGGGGGRGGGGGGGGSDSTEPPDATRLTGSYRKPLDLLHSAVREHWNATGTNDLQNYKAFFKRVVQILSLMEKELLSGEKEAQALREEVTAVGDRAEEERQRHVAEVQELSSQLEEAHGSIAGLDDQLRVVLEENVSLQQRLIKLEHGLLSSRIHKLTSNSSGDADDDAGS
ncbi:centrosomal protein of 72 kDa isoform X2 [Engraulis encrasicolus]|uniref:centrosomal protein of 72 kDa isoform X2 n=1 Tax=Engraulis encrasicolus TaxID=184585 RepID=UPI002FD24F70